MAKAKRQPPLPCKTATKSELDCFSESELDAAEQLIQLSGDSSSSSSSTGCSTNIINNRRHREEEVVSDCDTTQVVNMIVRDEGDDIDGQDHCFRKINGRDRGDRTVCGSGQIRKNKRFKTLSEIYSLTKPLS